MPRGTGRGGSRRAAFGSHDAHISAPRCEAVGPLVVVDVRDDLAAARVAQDAAHAPGPGR